MCNRLSPLGEALEIIMQSATNELSMRWVFASLTLLAVAVTLTLFRGMGPA